MPVPLEKIQERFAARLKQLDAVFERHVISPISPYRFDQYAFQEGLISCLWQSWCGFCRSTMIESAIGTTNAAGATITSPYVGRSEMEIAFISKRLAYNHTFSSIATLAGNHLEPTWGDLSKINLIATGLNTTNKATLLSAFGMGLSVKDLQICRNANSHVRISEIRDSDFTN